MHRIYKPTDGQAPETIAAWQQEAFEIYSRHGILNALAKPEHIDLDGLLVVDPKARTVTCPAAISREYLNIEGLNELVDRVEEESKNGAPQFYIDVMELARKISIEAGSMKTKEAKRKGLGYREKMANGDDGGLVFGNAGPIAKVQGYEEIMGTLHAISMQFAGKYGATGPVTCILFPCESGIGWHMTAIVDQQFTFGGHIHELDHIMIEGDSGVMEHVPMLVDSLCKSYSVPMHAAVMISHPTSDASPIVDVSIITSAYSDLERKPIVMHEGPIQ